MIFMIERFGRFAPYWEDSEFSQEVSPDPYSEEPLPMSIPHSRRAAAEKKKASDGSETKGGAPSV